MLYDPDPLPPERIVVGDALADPEEHVRALPAAAGAPPAAAPQQRDGAAPQPGNETLFGLLDNGDYRLNIAGGITIPAGRFGCWTRTR